VLVNNYSHVVVSIKFASLVACSKYLTQQNGVLVFSDLHFLYLVIYFIFAQDSDFLAILSNYRAKK
jgi:hypothetical protein